jgi:hypothetical protein
MVASECASVLLFAAEAEDDLAQSARLRHRAIDIWYSRPPEFRELMVKA